MSTRVIHGVGKPRLIIKEDYEVRTATSSTYNSVTVDLIIPDYINRVLYGQSSEGNPIYGKMISESGLTYGVDEWYGGQPAANSEIYYGGRVLDLPYCYELRESFIEDNIKVKLTNGNINIKRKGFWYSAFLDYSEFIDADTIKTIEPLLDTTTEFYLYPRRDNQYINFLCQLDEGIQYRKTRRGYKNFFLKIKGITRYSNIDLSRAPDVAVYGYGEFYADGMYG